MKRTLLAFAALLASTHALADECSNASNQTEMNQCTAERYQADDKKLNETYQEALKRASGKQQELLKKRSCRGLPCATPTVNSSPPALKAAAYSRC